MTCSQKTVHYSLSGQRSFALFQEIPIIQLNKVLNEKRIIRKRRAEEEERHMGSLTQNTTYKDFNACSVVDSWLMQAPALM
jgi:hypothetical protein